MSGSILDPCILLLDKKLVHKILMNMHLTNEGACKRDNL